MITLLKKSIEKHSKKLSLDPTDIQILQFSRSKQRKFEYGRITYLVFSNGKPMYVAKVYRSPQSNKRMQNEFSLLQKLTTNSSSIVFPIPTLLLAIDDYIVSLESFISGISHYDSLKHLTTLPYISKDLLLNTVRKNLANTYKCFIALHETKKRNSFHTLKKELNKHFVDADLSLTEIQKKYILDTASDTLQYRLSHFDFVPRNVLNIELSVGLIDFEFTEKSYLGGIEPARYALAMLLDMIELKFVKEDHHDVVISLFSSQKNFITKEIWSFLTQCYGNDSKKIERIFALAIILSFSLQKRVRRYIPQEEYQFYNNLLQDVLQPKADTSVIKIHLAQFEESLSKKEKGIQKLQSRLQILESERFILYNSRGYKLLSFVHSIRKKTPIFKRL